MELSALTVRLLLLFLPGIVCAYVLDAFTSELSKDKFFFLLRSFVFGVASYAIYGMLLRLGNKLWILSSHKDLSFLAALGDPATPIAYSEVFSTCLIGLVLGGFLAWSWNRRYPYRLAQRVGVSKRFGDRDVWGYIFNAESVEWATVRDNKYDLTYDGWVEAFSDDSRNAELLLREVCVYRTSTGDQIDRIDGLYIARDPHDVTIEFRSAEDENSE